MRIICPELNMFDKFEGLNQIILIENIESIHISHLKVSLTSCFDIDQRRGVKYS